MNSKFIANAYNARFFSELLKSIEPKLSAYLTQNHKKKGPVLLPTNFEDLIHRCHKLLVSKHDASSTHFNAESAIHLLLKHSNNLQNPNCMGHQVAPPIPTAALFELAARLMNQGSAVYEVGPITGACERALTRYFLNMIGWHESKSDILFTHGGTLANVTALISMRNFALKNCFTKGVKSFAKNPCIIVGEDSHYSISRAGGIMGMGTQSILLAKLNAERQLTGKSVSAAILKAKRRGFTPIGVVASSGSTSTGAFDCLEEISKVTKNEKLWLHVDAAHGGSVLFSNKNKYKIQGIQNADSITWDAHKMMHLPALNTMLFFKNKRHALKTFNQHAPYLLGDETLSLLEYRPAARTFECTRSGLGFILWATLFTFGPELFEDIVDNTFQVTFDFYEWIKKQPDFKAEHIPQSNIFCFRFTPKGYSKTKLNSLQVRLREELVKKGQFYITQTEINGETSLRVSIMNPLTTLKNCQKMIQSIRTTFRGLR